MANKQKKKRNKVYRGVDATIERPIVTKVTAVNRTKIGQWWFEHKRIARPILIAAAVVIVIIVLTIELIRIASGS